MELKQYLAAWWRWLWAIVLVAALGGAAGFFLSRALFPIYQTSATVLLPPPSSSNAKSLTALFSGSNGPTTVADLLQSRAVLVDVISNLRLTERPDDLSRQVSVTSARDTPVMYVSVANGNPELAAKIANEIPRVFNQQTRALEDRTKNATIASLEAELTKVTNNIVDTQNSLTAIEAAETPDAAERNRQQALLQLYQASAQSLRQTLDQARIDEMQRTDVLTVIDPAETPSTPVSPRPQFTGIISAIIAMIFMAGAIALRTALDDSVRTVDDVERLTGLPTIASVPSAKRNAPLLNVEAYRMLAAKLELGAAPGASRTFAITPAGAGESAATTTANLAAALAEIGKFVVVVDAVLANPQLHQILSRPNTVGVTTALSEVDKGAVYNHVQFTNYENLMLLSSGPATEYTDGVMRLPEIDSLIEELQHACDYVLFCTASLDESVDSLRLAHVCDATALVAKASTSRAKAINRAKVQLAEAGANLQGVVLEGVKSTDNRWTKRSDASRLPAVRRRLPDLRRVTEPTSETAFSPTPLHPGRPQAATPQPLSRLRAWTPGSIVAWIPAPLRSGRTER